MATQSLTDFIFDQDMRRVNFFNGRLLSGEDMRYEQDAQAKERHRLGRALGDGIAYGLEVRAAVGVDRVAAPTVTISPGLAVNREGQTLLLTDAVDVSLKAKSTSTGASTNGSTPGGRFVVCEPTDADAYVAGAGLYLLTLGTVEGREGRAPVSGLGNIEASCNTRYLVPGLRFRMIQLQLVSSDLNQPDLLRNRIAYRCLVGDPPVHDDFFTNLFGPPVDKYGLIDDLRAKKLQDGEVPLAVVYLTADNGLVFVDMWAARRRITAPRVEARFPLLTGDRRRAETEAMLMQFQDQLEDLRQSLANPAQMQAVNTFRYVPPVGIVPLISSRFARGFHEDLFFHTLTHAPIVDIEGGRIRAIVQAALNYPPLDLTSKVMVWIYRVRENQQAVQANAAAAPQPYVIFTTGHMPFMGDAHFDVNRWSFSNYSGR